MDAATVKQECQKFYELLQQPGGLQGGLQGGGQGSSTIEFIMRTLDQDSFNSSQSFITTTSPSNSNNNTQIMVNGINSIVSRPSQQDLQQQQQGVTSTLELDTNMVMQSLGISTEEDSETSSERPYVCQVCRASYKTRTHLRRHMFIHLNNRPYPCSDCGKGFNRKEHLNKHIEAVHSGTKHKCPFCSKEISRKDHLSRHIKNMHPAFSGSIKDMSPQDQSVLKVQLPCGQKQKAQLSFLTPSFPTTTTVGQTIITPIANINGKSKMSKLQHVHTLQQASPSSEQQQQLILEPYQQVAQLTFIPGIVLPSQLSMVGNPVVSSSPSSNGCSSPQKIAKLSNNVNNHNGLLGLTNLSLTLGGQIKEAPFANCGENKKMIVQVFNCSECSASFTLEKDLTTHARSHKPQNFRCSECPRAYTRREKLTEHIRCFHQGQKFKCDHCGKELSRKDHVLRHVRSIHPEVLASRFTAELQENGELGDERNGMSGSNGTSSAINEMGVLLRSVCHICLKVFGTSYHLSRHMESCHNGDLRPYSCNSCSKQFKRKDHLTKHMKSHCPSIRDATQVRTKLSPSKVKTDDQSIQILVEEDKRNKLREMKLEIATLEEASEDLDDEDEEENHKTDSDKQEVDEFNLAMINSFIAENVNVVVEEDLQTLLAEQHEEEEQPSNSSSMSQEIKNEPVKLTEVAGTESANSFASQMTTFPCGHCQREFPSRENLIDHLQDHVNDDDISHSDREQEPHQRITNNIQFSNY